MKLSRTSQTLCLAALTITTASFAAAEDAAWYVGGNIGQAHANIDEDGIARGLLSAGMTTTSLYTDERDLGFKVFGGYQFNKYFALESGYFDLGKFAFTAATAPTGTLRGNIKVRGINLDAVGFAPITDKFSAFARVGVNYAKATDVFAGSGAVNVLDPDRSKRAANIKYGVGLEYKVTPHLGLRAEAERYRMNDAVGNHGDIDLLSLGAVFRFGRTAAPAPRETPVAYTPAPAPALVVVPVQTATQQYCSILDFQFEINQDDIQREEKEKFAVVATFLNKYPDTTAVIEGHTDNVGTPEDNLKLSQRRADSVVSYLVNELHIAPARLKAVGYGDTRPIADNATEAGKRLNRRIGAVIACATDIEGLTVKPARITMALLVEFDQNKAEVKAKYHDELGKVANFLKANPTVTATVEGHTGNLQATPELAMEISQRRAQNVVNYLADNFGIARSRLTAEGFGQNRRFAYNTSLEGQQENRRVNIIINYPR
jgi:OOP family OmpA-OmpF porin